MELQEEFTGSNDHSPLIKRKRAKRKTPLSPPATTMTVTSSSSTGSAHGQLCPRIPSPTSSGNINSTAKEESDEDMANCLILLAQGDQKSDSTSPFDCKTCSRTFPSFQALGGHRASHKKPKSDEEAEAEEEKEKEEIKPKTSKMIIISPPILFHSETKKAPPLADTKSSSKAHGCSICGVAFSSGQALGGHMRRHRAPPVTPRTSASDKVDTTESCDEDDREPRKFMTLDLDLNLPAPFEDDFEFVASKRRFVLSGPALVDCHY